MHYSNRFLFITALFITCIMAANILIVKQISVLGINLPAAIIIFPVSYIFGDILTEVYGYGQARRVIWLGFFCNLLLVIAIWVVGVIPPAPIFEAQAAYDRILGNSTRFLLASFLAYLAGEFVNSFIMAKMKILTRGKYLWTRTIGSTFAGEGVDTTVVLLVGFWGVLPWEALLTMMLGHWLLKCVYEAVITPVTYLVVNYLKRTEKQDFYDYKTDFNPLRAD